MTGALAAPDAGDAALGAVLLVAAVIAVLTAVVATVTARRRSVPRTLGAAVLGLIGGYLVARGVAEFWVVDYADPASYRDDWGGPNLLGVFAVHSGPGLVVLLAASVWLYRRRVRVPARR